MKTIRLTTAQAIVRFLLAQQTQIDDAIVPLFAGCWAIFGHGNVAGLGEALWGVRDEFPTFRAHNEQAMALAAIAYAKQMRRRRMMVATSSIGPGATNMVTAAAVAHVNRLPVLLLPGDVFACRRPDPVLQQIEDFDDATVTANDCFRPVSRFFDRIQRPEQVIPALSRAMQVLTDPIECGPATIAMCQDVQTEAWDWPLSFFAERTWLPRRPRPDAMEVAAAAALIRKAKRPMIIAGGGVLYSQAEAALADLAERYGVPVGETQAGKGVMPPDHPLALGAIGVTGTAAANAMARDADVVLAVGTRLQDFTTGSWSLFANPRRVIVSLNIQPYDAGKHRAQPLVADAQAGLAELAAALGEWRPEPSWPARAAAVKSDWREVAAMRLAPSNEGLPSDAQVIGAVLRKSRPSDVAVGAAGGLPGELHKLWEAGTPGGYHMEYGYSCMGYEIAGAIGVKMAEPEREVFVFVGDGSYLMMNSEIATSVMLGLKLTVVLLDNRGFGCINRLQKACGGAGFNNLFRDARHEVLPDIDFATHAASMGAAARKVSSIADLEEALDAARDETRTTVIVIETDPLISTAEGGNWWEVAVPEVSAREEVRDARARYEAALAEQRIGD
jgi:3D-(3,5/4)-trihydroxycyclohexane-1,2-dione acylhydrolase (decyclizing)